MNEKLQKLRTISAYLLLLLLLELSAFVYISTIHLSPTQMSDESRGVEYSACRERRPSRSSRIECVTHGKAGWM